MAIISSAQLWRKKNTHTEVEAADGTAQVHCIDRALAWADTAGLQSQQFLSCSLRNVPTLCPSQCFPALRLTYLANILLVGHKVMESEVHHVRARYNCQSFQQKGAVRVIQVKNLTELLALQHRTSGVKRRMRQTALGKKKIQDTMKTWTQVFQQLQNYVVFLIFSYFPFLFCSLHHQDPPRKKPLWPTSLHKQPVLVWKNTHRRLLLQKLHVKLQLQLADRWREEHLASN